MAVRGVQYVRPVADLQPSAAGPRPVQVRRVPRPAARDGDPDADRDHDRDAAGRRGRDLDRRVRAPDVARAHRRLGHRDHRRHARHRDRAVRPGAVPAGHLRLDVVHRRGRRGVRALVPDRRRDDGAARAADGVRRDARGAAGDSRSTCARPRTRSARRAPRRSAASCCRRSRSNISTGAALGMGRIAGDTAIVVVLLGASLQLDPEGSIPGLRTLTGHRRHAHELRLQQLAGRRGQRARRRPTRRPSCCC